MISERVFGIDREIKAKIDSKYDIKREMAAREWLESVLGEPIPDDDLFEALKDGVILCRVLNIIRPNQPIKYNKSRMAFKQMENIAMFLKSAEQLGCPKFELFQTIDLYEKKHPNQVIDAIYSLSRHASKSGFEGSLLGPKLADKHVVEFTEEQLRFSKVIPILQSGYNGGATLSGTNFGCRRDVVGANPFK